MNKHISEFLSHYEREYDYYTQVGRIVQSRLEAALDETGIRAIVTSRAKTPARLRDKCSKRNHKRAVEYASQDEIYADIVDLVGVRIALYFPGERERVQDIISRLFSITERPKSFPADDDKEQRTGKRFSGYSAVHYRITIPESSLPEAEYRYSSARVEIQVATVLMHAWAEVEHDLAYKPSTGTLSADEVAILDGLNGLVLSGEIALKQLQEAGRRRVLESTTGFSNHYELAAYLLRELTAPDTESISAEGLGRVDLLFQLLSELQMASAQDVAPYLDDLHGDLERRPLAEQLIDALITDDPMRFNLYQTIRARHDPIVIDEHAEGEGSRTVNSFLRAFLELEGLLASLAPDERRSPISSAITRAARAGQVTDTEAFELTQIRRLRNELVHENPDVPLRRLRSGTDALVRIMKNIRDRLPDA